MAFLQLLVSYQQWRKEIIYWGDPIDNGNSMMMTYLNYHNRPTLNVSFSISPAIGFWHPNLNIGVKKQWMTIDGIEFNKPRPTIRFNNTFELPGDFLSVWMGFYGKRKLSEFVSVQNYGTVDISVRKSFLRDALSLELRGNDLFMVHVIIGKHILAVLFGSRLINGILVNFLLLCAISLIQQRASIKGQERQ